MTPQLFNFQNQYSIRIVLDEQGEPWFVVQDAAKAMGVVNSRDLVASLDDDEKKLVSVKSTLGQSRRMQVVAESGLYEIILSSHKSEAKAFKRWIRKEVLPTLRKTGTYSIRSLILPEPAKWEHTFPHEFMRQAMRLYNKPYDPNKGTPQFIGHFINKYVYACLDKSATKELKAARSQWSSDDDFVFLHQFLNPAGRSVLQDHLIAVVAVMKGSPNIDHFEQQFEKVFRNANQLELYLR